MLRSREDLNRSGKAPPNQLSTKIRARGAKKGSDRPLSAPADRSKDLGPQGGLFWRLQSIVTWAWSTSQERSHPLSLSLSLSGLSRPPPPPPNTLPKGSQSPSAGLKCLEVGPCGGAPYQIGSKRVRFTQKGGEGKEEKCSL